MQDIYYHRPRGLSTVFAKKFKIFLAEQKKVLLPPSGGGRRALFSAAARLLARAALRPGVPPCGLRCPVHSAVAPMRPALPPVRPGMPPCTLGCPREPSGVLCALGWACAACDVPMRPAMPPCALAVPPARPGATLHAPRCPAGLPQPCGASRPRNTQRASPLPRSNSLPRPAAVLSPAPPHGREKARPLQKERPGLVHFAVRR